MILQLNPPIPMQTPKGKALAQILIDYGAEHDLVWVCFGEKGECWSWRNQDVRADSNLTFGRTSAPPPASDAITALQKIYDEVKDRHNSVVCAKIKQLALEGLI
jgi:hypothetical protein